MEETSEYRSTINKLEVCVHTGGDISPDLQGFIFNYHQGYISSLSLCSFFIDYLIIYLVFDTVKIRKLNVCFMVLQSLKSYLFKHLSTKTGLFTPHNCCVSCSIDYQKSYLDSKSTLSISEFYGYHCSKNHLKFNFPHK